tara:strand:- start:1668 stop:2204 length:537 start_codon:yes stop_codon:yes gene_type:complete
MKYLKLYEDQGDDEYLNNIRYAIESTNSSSEILRKALYKIIFAHFKGCSVNPPSIYDMDQREEIIDLSNYDMIDDVVDEVSEYFSDFNDFKITSFLKFDIKIPSPNIQDEDVKKDIQMNIEFLRKFDELTTDITNKNLKMINVWLNTGEMDSTCSLSICYKIEDILKLSSNAVKKINL